MAEKFRNIFSKHGFNISDDILNKFILFANVLLEENRKYNLIRFNSEEDMIERHFVDSYILSKEIDRGSLLDIGSGAGFPGIILAIVKDIKVTLVESISKKSNFLNMIVDRLCLNNIEVINSRVEDIDKKDFDYTTARAVASLPIISEYSMPLLRIGGKLLAQKGPRYKEEIEITNFDFLGSQLSKITEYKIMDRNFYIVEVVKISNKITKPRKNLRKIFSSQ